MMAAELANIELKAGATLRLAATVRGADGLPLDITGWQVDMHVRDGARLVHAFAIAIDDGAAGRWSTQASAAQTAAWPPGRLQSDVRYRDAAGNVVFSRTFAWGVERAQTVVAP